MCSDLSESLVKCWPPSSHRLSRLSSGFEDFAIFKKCGVIFSLLSLSKFFSFKSSDRNSDSVIADSLRSSASISRLLALKFCFRIFILLVSDVLSLFRVLKNQAWCPRVTFLTEKDRTSKKVALSHVSSKFSKNASCGRSSKDSLTSALSPSISISPSSLPSPIAIVEEADLIRCCKTEICPIEFKIAFL